MSQRSIDDIVDAIIQEIEQRQAPVSASVAREGGRPEQAFQPARRRASATGLTVAVLGAGNGGLCMAGHMSLMGVESVRLFSFFDFELAPVIEKGGIEIQGSEISGFAKIGFVTGSIDAAVRGADLIMIVAPAVTHAAYATLLASLLKPEQTVVLNPGRTGGALEFARLLRRFALQHRIYLAEAQTFMYAAELRGPGAVEMLKEKFTMRVAALPASDTPHVVEVLNRIYPQIQPAQNVLETSVNNVGPVVHPAPMLLNTALIERAAAGEDLRYYKHQVNPTVATLVMEKIDAEKMAIGRALGVRDIWSVRDWYRESYHVEGESLYEVLQANPYYQGFHAPKHLLAYNHILDEVPNSLVPLSSLGKIAGVPTPTIDTIVDLACVMTEIDFWHEGRTLRSLGLDGMSLAEVQAYVDHRPILGRCAEVGICQTLPQFSSGA